jgi:fused signal recognition particle receptor
MDPSLAELLAPAIAWVDANAAWVGHGFSAAVLVLFEVLRRRYVVRAAPAPAAPPAPSAAPAAPESVARPAAVEAAPAAAPRPAPERLAAPVAEPHAAPVVEPLAARAPEPLAAPVPERAPEPPAPPPRPLRERLSRTRDALVGGLARALGGRRVDEGVLEELEALLFGADLGVRTAESLLEAVRKGASGGDAESVRRVLREAILVRLRRVEPAEPPPGLGGRALGERPHVILVLGVNGSGKTTTIGKLAARYRAAGCSVVLGAGDTFRAAATEQLQIWGERTGCDVVAGTPGGDPAAVAFDAIQAARARGADVAIVDTAGRLQTKAPLMEELGKIARVIGRELPGAPHETLLVLDANTGQNALSQARLFTEVAPVSAIALTKLDGTAKGGVIVGLADEFGIPVRWVGVGEGAEDLREFRAADFVEALFGAG